MNWAVNSIRFRLSTLVVFVTYVAVFFGYWTRRVVEEDVVWGGKMRIESVLRHGFDGSRYYDGIVTGYYTNGQKAAEVGLHNVAYDEDAVDPFLYPGCRFWRADGVRLSGYSDWYMYVVEDYLDPPHV